MKLAIVAFAALAICLTLFWWYRTRSSGELSVQFIVPDDYRGIFRLTIDPATEDMPAQDNGVWIYRIPSSGMLPVKRRFPLSDWHRTSAVYASGAPLEFAQSSPAAPYRETVRLHAAGSATRPDGSNTIDFFVGTDQQMREISTLVDRPLGGIIH